MKAVLARLGLVMVGVLAVGACGTRYYNNSELTLIVNSSAKETCSCVFVLGRPEDQCREYSRLIGPRQVVLFSFDHAAGLVDARLGAHHAVARWRNAQQGCVIEEP
jgi:hypothetical protein